jgi:hypothetical protein
MVADAMAAITGVADAMAAITGVAPRKGAQAAHRMAVGRVRPYVPRSPHTRAIAERTRTILAELAAQAIKPTLRQLFYLLVNDALVAKTEKGYELVQEQTTRMRTGGWIAMDSLIDGTRSRLAWRFHARPSEALEAAVWSYARDPWRDQPVRAELWLEADTHREMLRPVASELAVTMVVTRGNASLPLMYESAEEIAARYQNGQRTRIVYVGDFDPPGLDMSWHLHERLVEQHMPPEACVVDRVALTYEQIKQKKLPERPPKKSDSRTPWFEEMFDCGCVELDALAPPRTWSPSCARACWTPSRTSGRGSRTRCASGTSGGTCATSCSGTAPRSTVSSRTTRRTRSRGRSSCAPRAASCTAGCAARTATSKAHRARGVVRAPE